MTKLLYLLLLLLVVPAVSAVNLTYYQQVSDIKVDCDSFVGYARFDVDDALLAASQNLNNLYIDTEYFFDRSGDTPLSNWYVGETNAGDLDSMKKVFDGSTSTYVAVQSPAEFVLTLRSPTSQTFNKIVLTTVDSEIDSVTFSIRNVGTLTPVASWPQFNNGQFTYTYLFDKTTTGELVVRIGYKNIVKLAQISLQLRGSDRINLFVDNSCQRIYKMYFGGYGGTEVSYQRHDMTKIVDAHPSTPAANPLYNDDFDHDGVQNTRDNCVYVPNPDQQDLNYNGIGDACEDFDADGVMDANDNCPKVANYNQMDVDKDGIGDACDSLDNRFSEQNKGLFYVGGILAVAIFGYLAYLMIKK